MHLKGKLIDQALIFSWLLLSIVFSTQLQAQNCHDGQRFIYDQQGRAIFLRGLNTSSSAKSDPRRLPWITEQDVGREQRKWGFNFTRFLIFWDAIEPMPGFIDYQYLKAVRERIRWYQKHQIWVMLDMHQDIYSSVFGGDGAPAWAVHTDGLAAQVQDPWWLTYLQPGVIRAWDYFWQTRQGQSRLQKHYINAWVKVAEYFQDMDNVIGYDLMNEPFGGSALWPQFGRDILSSFYQQLIHHIRQVDQERWIFIEPQALGVNFGIASSLTPLKDPRPAGQKLVYAPHFYPPFIHEGVAYTGRLPSFTLWQRNRYQEAGRWQMPLIIGEFGIHPDQIGASRFVYDVIEMANCLQAGWAFWSNDPGGWAPLDHQMQETAIVDAMVQTYAPAVAGQPIRIDFNRENKTFVLEYHAMPNRGHTEIYIPAKRHYPDGFQVHLSISKEYWQGTWQPALERYQIQMLLPVMGRVRVTVRKN